MLRPDQLRPDPGAGEGVAPRPPGGADPLAALVEGARRGEPPAVRALLEAVAPTVFRAVAAVYGRGHGDLDDVTQQALLQVLRALRTFRGDSSFGYFATRIALRTAIKQWRAGRRRRRREEEWQRLSAPAVDLPARPDGRLAERAGRLWGRLLDDLPAAQAETLVLRVVLGHSLEQTAEATGVPFNTVRSRLRAAPPASLVPMSLAPAFNTVRSRLRAALDRLRRRFDEDPTLADLLEGR